MAPNSLSSSEMGTLAKTHYAWLLPLFIGSGCAALMYEIIWFQSLQLIVGASALSLGVLLSTFMGGMCIGSLILPLIVPRRWHPLRVYAGLELGIALAAFVLLDLLPTVEAFYVSEFHSGAANIWQANVISRAVIAGLCLLPPTILMGATLPAIARWFESNPQGVSQTGLFYTANIFGAVIGCLLAPFYLLRLFDMVTATYCAIAINVVVAGLGLAASYALPYEAHNAQPQGAKSRRSFQPVAYLAIGISGFAALGAEVVWTRELSLLLGATVYTFALILAVFLVALSLGSGVGSAWAKRLRRADLAFAFCQWSAALGVVWAAWITAQSLPYWPIDVSLTTNPWLTFQLDLVRVAWAVFPAAFSWGCSFPLALATAARGQDSGKMVGGIYAANTLGAIFGAVGCSWLAIPQFGVQITHQIIIAALLLSAVLLMGATLFSRFRSSQKRSDSEIDGLDASRATTSYQFLAAALLFVALTATAWAALRLPAPPPGLAGYGRYLVTWLENGPEFLYSADGLSSSIAVSEFDDGQRNFHVSGKVVASSEAQDMRLQRMLGHLPALLCEAPKSVLIVGCGAGVTAGCFVNYPTIERIVICEIEPLIPQAAGKYFSEFNHAIMDDPRLEVVFDDARHFMLTTQEKFDIITSDPIHPWVKGAAALYSKEYFELTLQHLNEGGIVTQWVPLYESSLEAVRSEVATFMHVFPHGTLWTNDSEYGGYDIVMLGQENASKFDLPSMDAKLSAADYDKVAQSLADIKLDSAMQLAKTFGGDRELLERWYESATLNTDRNLHLQYSAGWALNRYQEANIRDSLKPFAGYPKDLFSGTPEQVLELERWFSPQTKR